jgi:hypothetical protein
LAGREGLTNLEEKAFSEKRSLNSSGRYREASDDKLGEAPRPSTFLKELLWAQQ